MQILHCFPDINTYICQKLRRHVTLTTPTWGQFVIITRLILLASIRAQNLTILSSAIPEKFKGVQNSKMEHMTLATPFLGMVINPKANIWHNLQAHKIWRL